MKGDAGAVSGSTDATPEGGTGLHALDGGDHGTHGLLRWFIRKRPTEEESSGEVSATLVTQKPHPTDEGGEKRSLPDRKRATRLFATPAGADLRAGGW